MTPPEAHPHTVPLTAVLAKMELYPREGRGVGGAGEREPLAVRFLGRGWVDAELGEWTREEAVFLPRNSVCPGEAGGGLPIPWGCSWGGLRGLPGRGKGALGLGRWLRRKSIREGYY